jgi:gliding motility-associated-like protein
VHEFHIEQHPCDVSINMGNVFTPNNDGVNDFFVPINYKHVQEYRLLILNRWGTVIFESTDIEIGWDGTIHGEDASESVYFWKVDYAGVYGNNNTIQGSLTLVR